MAFGVVTILDVAAMIVGYVGWGFKGVLAALAGGMILLVACGMAEAETNVSWLLED